MMMQNRNEERVSASFRDPSGFLFWEDGILYRQINKAYQKDYDFFVQEGLYEKLQKGGKIIPHEEVPDVAGNESDFYKVIKPTLVPFISYPYEWSFSQLKDAALVTLEIQKKALDFGMTLKDASAYNIQFYQGKPVLIDTLSLERYEEGKPWIAYRQFCQHFLAPLALMSFRDVRLNQLLRVYIDGIPLDLASSLLPLRAKLSFGLLSHIYAHAKSQKYFAGKQVAVQEKRYRLKKFSLLALLDNLEATVRKLQWKPGGTEWGEYYRHTNYVQESFEHKKALVSEFLKQVTPKTVWDVGANTGEFSRLASEQGILTIAFDIDPAAVERNYRFLKKNKAIHILPLLMDFTNPSPGLGWENTERINLFNRGPADTVLALALIHHLAISHNLPFQHIAQFLARICKDSLVIEFVPKEDSNVQRLLSTREDIFPDYKEEIFEGVLQQHFYIQRKEHIKDSERILYLMIKK